MLKEFAEILKSIITTPAGIVVLLGAVLLGLGAAGGVTYNRFFPIEAPLGRGLLAVLGAALVVAAAVRLLGFAGASAPDAARFETLGIRITHPERNDVADGKIRVTVVSDKPLPAGYELRVLRMYDDGGILPDALLGKTASKLEWTAPAFDVAGAPRIGAWLVGPDGRALLDAWLRDHETHRLTLDELRRVAAIANLEPKMIWLRPILARTADMHACACVEVRNAGLAARGRAV